MSSTEPQLPSASDLDGALQQAVSSPSASTSGGNDANLEAWRSLTLRLLSYGTSYDSPSDTSSAEDGETLKERSVAAAQCLVDAMSRFISENADESSSDEDREVLNQALEMPRAVVTDCLWLVGTLLESAPSSAAAGQKGKGKANPRYDALASLVNSLSYGTGLDLSSDNSSMAIPAIPLPTLQKRLEPPLLASANLLPQKSTKFFLKKFTTANTNAYYRQVRFNLLQEESEGWSKLLTLLGGLPGNVSSIEDALVRVRELIGAFDLDPNRVLDLVVDFLEREVASILEGGGKLGGGGGIKRSVQDLLRNDQSHVGSVEVLVRIAQGLKVKSLPHLLGFKYASYAQRGGTEDGGNGNKGTIGQTPRTLHLTAALLVVRGLVDPEKLVPHLSPELEVLRTQHETYEADYVKKIKKMGTVSLNAAAAAEEKKDDGATAAPTGDKTAAPTATSPTLGIESNQVVGLFQALVEVGAPWDVAASLFASLTAEDTKFSGADAVAALHEPVGKAVCTWVKNSIQAAYDEKVGNIGKELVRSTEKKKSKSSDKGDAASGSNTDKQSILPQAVLNKTSLAPSATMDDLCSTLKGPLSTIVASGAIRHDPVLYCMICRLVNSMTSSTDDGDVDEATYTFLRTFLVPCLSLFPSNPSISTELWSVLSKLPYQIRYGLYGSSRLAGLEKGAVRTSPRTKALPIIEAEVRAGIEIRYSLKRLSKDNIKDTGRALSKTSHSNPIVVFTTILNQIESYDNLIQMMVDTFIHTTELSLDVLGYCLLVALGGGDSKGGRSKLKADGVNAAQWLSSLETFAGAFYKKFPKVEMHGLLSYLVKRLVEGEILELGVFRTLLKTAGSYGFADCESTAGLSDTQLDGRAGSQLLKRETSDFGIVEKFSRTASIKLRSVLQDHDVGAVILILLSQMRSRILYFTDKSTPKHIKLIGSRYDSCQMVLSVLIDFLTDTTEDQGTASGSIARYAAALPELSELHQTYGLEPAASWMLCRPLIRAAMFEQEEKEAVPAHLEPYLPHTDSMQTTSAAMLPETCWKYLTRDLFEMFYSHSLYDIHCPETRYKTEIVRLDKDKDRLRQLKQGGEGARAMMASMAAAAAAAGGTDSQIRKATAFTRDHERDLERLTRHSGILAADLKRQKKHCGEVRKTFEEKKTSLLKDLAEGDVQKGTAGTFLTYCIYPRCLLTPEDALYCAEFVMLLHTMEIPGFFTLQYVDHLINAVVGAAYSSTEDEAGNLSILLKSTWAWVKSWRDEKAIFDKEVAGKPGAMMDDGSGGFKELSFEGFKQLFNKWHAILGQTFLGCISSKEYIHTRAGLIFLSRTVNVFPTRPALGEKIMEALVPLKEDTNRQDLRSMALGYSSQLIKARDEGVWEENSAAAKARREKKEKEAEERKKAAEKQFQEMRKESEAYDRQQGGGRRDYDDRGRGPPPPRGGGPLHGVKSPLNPSAAKFTPAGGGPPRDLRSGDHSRDHSARNSRERDDRYDHRRGPDRGPDRREMEGRWERGTSHGDRQGGRDVRKRSRSPGRDMDRREEDAKRMRSQAPPPPPRGRGGPDFRSASPPRGGRRGGDRGDHGPPPDRHRRRSR